MEALFFILCSAAIGYVISKLERIENRINSLEDEILRISFHQEKRK